MRHNWTALFIAAYALGTWVLSTPAVLSQSVSVSTDRSATRATAAGQPVLTPPPVATAQPTKTELKRKRHWFTAWLNKDSDAPQAADEKSLIMGARNYNAQRQYIPDWTPDEFIMTPGGVGR